MKKKYVICLTTLILCPPLWMDKSEAASVDITAEAVVSAAVLTGTQDQSLNFGSIVTAGTAATITINASGGGGVLPSVTSGTASVTGGHNARIDVASTLNANLAISYPATITITETTGGVATMTINNIGANSTPSPLAVTSAGPNKIYVGGVLGLGSGQLAGTYRNLAVPITFIYE